MTAFTALRKGVAKHSADKAEVTISHATALAI